MLRQNYNGAFHGRNRTQQILFLGIEFCQLFLSHGFCFVERRLIFCDFLLEIVLFRRELGGFPGVFLDCRS